MSRSALQILLFSGIFRLAQASAPVVFYTDLDSGPKNGGEGNAGAYVTVYGKNFGTSRGTSTVTFGGGAVASYSSWSDARIAVQLGASAATGAVVVTISGIDSNSNVTFTVRSGNIYFVAIGGSDSDSGNFANPWATLVKCRQSIAAGDICYGMNGVSQTAVDGFNTALTITGSGTISSPKAIVAYPSATVTVGGSPQFGLRPPSIAGAPFEYWTIAGLRIIGGPAGSALTVAGRGWRVVGNELTCPEGNGASACFEGSFAMHSKFLGNEVHDAGCGETTIPCAWTNTNTTLSSSGTALTLSGFQSGLSVLDRILAAGQQKRLVSCGSSTSCVLDSPFSPDLPPGTSWQFRDYVAVKLYHSVYYSTDSSDVEIGWNNIHDNQSCRGIQFHSSPTIGSVPVSAASNASPIVISYTSTLLFPETRIFVSGVTGNSGANGAFFLDPINATSARLWLDKELSAPSVGTGSGTGGTIQNGLNQYDISVHDNIVSGQVCDGINLATVDPSLGPVTVSGNIVYSVGAGASDGISTGLDPAGGPANYAGIYNAATTNTGPAGSGTIQAYSNTFYNNGNGGTSGRGAFGSNGGGPSINIENNIFLQSASGGPYAETGSSAAAGQNNSWFGKGASPSGFTSSLNADPSFFDPTMSNAWIGFRPLNPSVRTAGSDGLYIGAVAPATGSAFVSGNFSVGGNGAIH